jgi:hypothetical protein
MNRLHRRESPAVVGLMMVALLALGGCAGKSGSTSPSASPTASGSGTVRVSGKSMCEAHGGTFNASAQHCTYTTQSRPVSQSCEAQGGYYDTAAGFCQMGRP